MISDYNTQSSLLFNSYCASLLESLMCSNDPRANKKPEAPFSPLGAELVFKLGIYPSDKLVCTVCDRFENKNNEPFTILILHQSLQTWLQHIFVLIKVLPQETCTWTNVIAVAEPFSIQ